MIYFVRHGETNGNVDKIMQGHMDIPLNQNGIQQAKEVGEILKNVNLEVIFSSPLSRALKTAQIINKYHGLDIVVDERIKEFYSGAVQGTKMKEWSEQMRKDYFDFPEKFGAETWQAFYDRVVSFFKEIQNSHKTILIVSHSGVYRNIYRYLNNIKDFHFDLDEIKNASIVEIDEN